MMMDTFTTEVSYDPVRLLDTLKEMLRVESDVALSDALELPPIVINEIRQKGYPIGASILLRMHTVTQLSVQELRDIMGDRRKRFRTVYDAAFPPPLS